MDALPPPPVNCEAPAQDVLLTVNASADEDEYSAFVGDLQSGYGAWTLVSDNVLDSKRTLIFRARMSVTYKAVMDATFNASARGWTTSVTFAEPSCT
mgnify:FL=1